MGLSVPLRLRRFYFVDVGAKAAMAYIPKPYAGSIILFKCEKRSDNPQEDWGKLPAKGLEIYAVPGAHLDIIQNPHIQKIVATLLKVHLHEAQIGTRSQGV